MSEQRTLSDGDVAAIVEGLEKRLTDKFYRDVGKGIWGLVWKALLGVALVVAAYGAAKGAQ